MRPALNYNVSSAAPSISTVFVTLTWGDSYMKRNFVPLIFILNETRDVNGIKEEKIALKINFEE